MSGKSLIPSVKIESLLHRIRGQNIMLDNHLAILYGIETRTLIQAVKRNTEPFPQDFMFQLNEEETKILQSQIVMSKF